MNHLVWIAILVAIKETYKSKTRLQQTKNKTTGIVKNGIMKAYLHFAYPAISVIYILKE